MLSSKAIRQGLYQRLNSDTAITDSLENTNQGGINHAVAPSDRGYPLVIFHKQSGTPVNLRGFTPNTGGTAWDGDYGHAAQENQLWTVKAIAQGGSPSVAEDVAAAIADRLAQPFTVTGGTIVAMHRESDVDYAEVSDGEVYHHHGALYRIVTET